MSAFQKILTVSGAPSNLYVHVCTYNRCRYIIYAHLYITPAYWIVSTQDEVSVKGSRCRHRDLNPICPVEINDPIPAVTKLNDVSYYVNTCRYMYGFFHTHDHMHMKSLVQI